MALQLSGTMIPVGRSQAATPQQASASATTAFTELDKAGGWDDEVIQYVSETLGDSSSGEFASMFPRPEIVVADFFTGYFLPDEPHLAQLVPRCRRRRERDGHSRGKAAGTKAWGLSSLAFMQSSPQALNAIE